MGDDGVCNVSTEPSGLEMLTRNTSLARVLFFLEPATPIRASTSALRSFRIPTQSTLQRETHTAQLLDWQAGLLNKAPAAAIAPKALPLEVY